MQNIIFPKVGRVLFLAEEVKKMWVVLILDYAINHLELRVEVMPRLNHIRNQKVRKAEDISSGNSNQRTFVGSKTVNISPRTFVLTQGESVVNFANPSVCRI